MKYYIIVFKNTHDAMTAEKKLGQLNYKFRIMPTPTLITQSCGICVRIENEEEVNNIIENKECFNIKQLKISGNELIKVGLKGKEIGEMLNYLLDMVMEDKAINNTEELIKFAKEKIN